MIFAAVVTAGVLTAVSVGVLGVAVGAFVVLVVLPVVTAYVGDRRGARA